LNEKTANSNEITSTIESNFGISDPILLDFKFNEIIDSSQTRGLLFFILKAFQTFVYLKKKRKKKT